LNADPLSNESAIRPDQLHTLELREMPFVDLLQLALGEVDFEEEHCKVGSVRVGQLVNNH
jgi:hypothetical protein